MDTTVALTALMAAVGAFNVRLTTGDGFRNPQGFYSLAVLTESSEWQGVATAMDDAKRELGEAVFGP